MAPWTHTYCSPQGERRLCCASREPSTNFKQYIDTDDNDNKNVSIPSLEQHWNSNHMKSVRRRMLAGEKLPECEVCNNQLLNTDVYRSYFERLFAHHRERAIAETLPDGTYPHGPVSFDYRFSNLCNFKCRMCGPMLSSSWETESKKHDPYIEQFETWMQHKPLLKANQDRMYTEMLKSIEQQTLEEIYWVGGEPLMFEEHWDIMQKIQDKNIGQNIFVRYNTNLSRITYKNKKLFEDYLDNVRDWQIWASIDGTGTIGEYIRTGLVYEQFLENFHKGKQHETKPNQMRLDFTLTLPGLLEIENMFDLSVETNSMLLTKVCFTFSSDVPMSPLLVDRKTMNTIVDDALNKIKHRAGPKQRSLIDTLENLKTRNLTEDDYDDYTEGRKRAKQKIIELEHRRGGTTMDKIVKGTLLEKWWRSI